MNDECSWIVGSSRKHIDILTLKTEKRTDEKPFYNESINHQEAVTKTSSICDGKRWNFSKKTMKKYEKAFNESR